MALKRSNWVPINDAVLELADLKFSPFSTDHLTAWKQAWLPFRELLCSGELESKPGNWNEFCWILSTPNGEAKCLKPVHRSAIPAEFWFHYFEAADRAAKRPMPWMDKGSEDFCERSGADFDFAITGLRDEASMRGQASGVMVKRDQVPGLPTGRGRTQGSGGFSEQDKPIVAEALAYMEETGEGPHAAAVRFAHKMPGGGNELSKKKRLRLRLGAAQ